MNRFFLPPVNRAMVVLDRTFFKKTIPLTAAHIFNQNELPMIQERIAQDLLPEKRYQRRIKVLRGAESELLVLRPEVKYDDISTVSAAMKDYIKRERVELAPYDLQLEYGDWNYEEILSAVLPEDPEIQIPEIQSLKRIGPLANLALSKNLHPYRRLIAEVICDKDRTIQTVFGKPDQDGHAVRHGLKNEVLAGPPTYHAELNHQGSNYTFRLDNARFEDAHFDTSLAAERKRLVETFSLGQAVAVVHSGVGSLVIPAAKRGAIMFANEPNGNVYDLLVANRKNNKVKKNVYVKHQLPQKFIKSAVKKIFSKTIDFQLYKRSKTGMKIKGSLKKQDKQLPGCISHFVLSDPVESLDCMDCFRGIYSGREKVFARGDGYWNLHLPTIHFYFYHEEPESGKHQAGKDMLESIGTRFKHEIEPENVVSVRFVKQEAPDKSLYCVTFKLPAPVAFALTEEKLRESTAEIVKRKEDQEKYERYEFTPRKDDDDGDDDSEDESEDEGPLQARSNSRLSRGPQISWDSRGPPRGAELAGSGSVDKRFAESYKKLEGVPNWKAKVHRKKSKELFVNRFSGREEGARPLIRYHESTDKVPEGGPRVRWHQIESRPSREG